MKLKDKVAIITGGGRGIGKAYALRFAQEGAKVVVADIILPNAQEVAKEITNNGRQALALYTDITKEESTVEMAQTTQEKFGALDILLNNAAIYGGLKRIPWDTWKLEDWDRLHTVNVVGTWLCVKAVAPYMIKQGRSKIINISSSVVWAGQPHLLPYSCTKGAIVAMTTSLAKALGPDNITVNAIAPGWALSEAATEAYPDNLEEKKAQVRSSRPLKKDVSPEDIAGTAVYLASEDSDLITGQVITVDGGSSFRF